MRAGIEKSIAAMPGMDELEIPLPPKELELPRLEFPALSSEEKSQYTLPTGGAGGKQQFTFPSLDALEEEIPAELPDLEAGTKPSLPTSTPSSFPATPSLFPQLKFESKPSLPVMKEKAEKLEAAETEEAQEEELEEPVVVQHIGGPLYINISGYKRLLLASEDIRDHLKHSNDRLDHLNTLKGKEDSALEAWHSSLENIQRKMIFIDRSLFEQQEG